MAPTHEWSVAEARTLTFDGPPVSELHVRVAGGAVNVVGTDDPVTRLEVSRVEGPPLGVWRKDGHLVVAYDDIPWQGLLRWLNRGDARRHAVVSVRVPASARLTVAVVSASAMVSGIAGRADVRGVNGDITLVGLTGAATADTVSGGVETQSLGGPLRFNSVSGDLTAIDSASPRLRAESVSGDMVVDLAPHQEPATVRLATVTGEVALRLPEPVSARVRAATTRGAISSAFAELAAEERRGARQLSGTLGSGADVVRCTTISGPIALLRRPGAAEEATAATFRKDV